VSLHPWNIQVCCDHSLKNIAFTMEPNFSSWKPCYQQWHCWLNKQNFYHASHIGNLCIDNCCIHCIVLYCIWTLVIAPLPDFPFRGARIHIVISPIFVFYVTVIVMDKPLYREFCKPAVVCMLSKHSMQLSILNRKPQVC